MKKNAGQGVVYLLAFPDDAIEEARALRKRLFADAQGEPSRQDRELPGILWGFLPTPPESPDRLSHAVSGAREAVLRGDPVWLEPVSPRPCTAVEVLKAWEGEGAACFRLIDNLSLALVADAQAGEVIVATDRTGGIRLYSTRVGRVRVLCTSYLRVAKLVAGSEVDGDALGIFFHLGYFPGTRTALREVSVHSFGTITRVGRRTWREEPYWTPNTSIARDEPIQEVIERGIEAFNATVREYASGRDLVYLAMTAGLDSRTVASSLIRQKIPFKTYTHGFPGCWEGRRVESIVKRHGIPHRFVPLQQGFLDRMRELTLESFRATEGEISCIEKSHLLHVLSLLREETSGTDVALFLGGGAGMLKGTFYRLLSDEQPYAGAGVDRYVAWNLSKRLPDIFAAPIRARDGRLLREFVSASLDEAGGGSFFQRLDYFYLVRYRRWAGGVKGIYREFFPVREPFVSAHLLDYLFAVDPAIKKAKAPHFEILARNAPSLRYDLTNQMSPALPLTVRNLHRFLPSLVWRAKQLVRGFSRRYLPREIFRLVDYVDYKSWIREPSGRSLVEELLRPEEMRSAFLYDREKLVSWLAKERETGFGSFPLIDKVCTLELFFREIGR